MATIVIIFLLLSASASIGLAIGLFLLPGLAILLASPCVALLSALVLLSHDFGLAMTGLISIGSLTALQSFYLVGVWIRLNCAPRFAEIIKRAASRLGGSNRYRSIAVGDDEGLREGLDPSCALTVGSAKRLEREANVRSRRR
jgi:hypothetical protein